MKNKNILRIITVAIISLLTLTACTNNASGVKEFKGKDEVKTASEEFYKQVLSDNHLKMITTMNGAKSEFSIDEDKMHYKDETSGIGYYLFTKDSHKYVMYEDGEPVEDEQMYDMTRNTINNVLGMFLNGLYEVDDDSLVFSAKQTKQGDKDTFEVNVEISGEEKATMTTVGTKQSDKVVNIAIEYNDSAKGNEKFNFDFDYENYVVNLPEYELPVARTYTHVDSPVKTVGELDALLAKDENLHYMIDGEDDLYIGQKIDDRYYQFYAKLSQEKVEALTALDFFADDYSEKALAIISDVEFSDCIDLTEFVLSQDKLDGLIGLTLEELMNQGFEQSGYSVYDDVCFAYAYKDIADYVIELDMTEKFAEDAEIEFDDLLGFKVKKIEFNEFNLSEFPLR